MKFDAVVFDLGGVLVDWNPRYLLRKILNDERLIEQFLAEVCNQTWNERQDAGRLFSEAIAERIEKHPEHSDLIRAYFARWPEMLGGAIEGSVQVLESLHDQKRVQLFALSNWSAETFPYARARFGFLKLFRSILVSGEEKLIKPDPRFFALLSERHKVVPERSVFIDDVQKNVDAGRFLGFESILFTDAKALRQKLSHLGILIET